VTKGALELPTLRGEPWGIESESMPRHLTGQLEECILGDHEGCPGHKEAWRDAYNQESSRYTRRCSCGCHLPNPWPWPCAEDPE
jgi:hypothetical protein